MERDMEFSSSSDEEDATLRIRGRDVVDCVTTGEELPGDRIWGVPVTCDMVAGLRFA